MKTFTNNKIYKNTGKAERGFSLIEVLVAFTIFTLIMVTAIGALTSVISANRKAQSIKSVMNNLNFALESMAREIRTGTAYHCKPGSSLNPQEPPEGGNGVGQIGSPKDCPNGGVLLAFKAVSEELSALPVQIVYRFINGRIQKCDLNCAKNAGGDYISITAPNVVIDDFRFYVQGAKRGDNKQPYVIMTLRGAVGVDPKESSEFQIQTTVSQRIIDF